MRTVGLGTVFLLVILALSSMIVAPVERGPDSFPSWWRPAAVSDPPMTALEWNAPSRWMYVLVQYCAQANVPVWIAARMFSAESSRSGRATDAEWQEDATSYVGAKGYAQIMKANLTSPLFIGFNDGKTPIDPEDPETAIRIGVRYLAYLHDMLGRWRFAIEAYNAGPARWLKGDLPGETLYYSKKIMGGQG